MDTVSTAVNDCRSDYELMWWDKNNGGRTGPKTQFEFSAEGDRRAGNIGDNDSHGVIAYFGLDNQSVHLSEAPMYLSLVWSQVPWNCRQIFLGKGSSMPPINRSKLCNYLMQHGLSLAVCGMVSAVTVFAEGSDGASSLLERTSPVSPPSSTVTPLKGDFNFNGYIDLGDVTVCALAWRDRPSFFLQYPTVNETMLTGVGDFNGDGVFDDLDIDPYKSFIIETLTAAQGREPENTAGTDPVAQLVLGMDTGSEPKLIDTVLPEQIRTVLVAGVTRNQRPSESDSHAMVYKASNNSGGGGGGGGGGASVISGGGGGGGGGGPASSGGGDSSDRKQCVQHGRGPPGERWYNRRPSFQQRQVYQPVEHRADFHFGGWSGKCRVAGTLRRPWPRLNTRPMYRGEADLFGYAPLFEPNSVSFDQGQPPLYPGWGYRPDTGHERRLGPAPHLRLDQTALPKPPSTTHL